MSLMRSLGLLLLVGCGSRVPLGDEMNDDASPAEALRSVEVTVVDFGGPVPGIDVVFHDATGAPIDTQRTDASGIATAEMRDPGAITVASFGTIIPGWYELASVLGVTPGDAITIDLGDDPRRNETVSVARISLEPFPGAATYAVATCTSGWGSAVGTPIELDVARRCLDEAGDFRVFAEAKDAAGARIAFTWIDAHARIPSATEVAMPAWRTELYAVDVLATGVPEDATLVHTSAAFQGDANAAADYRDFRPPLSESVTAQLRVPVMPGTLERSLFVAFRDPDRDSFSSLVTMSPALDPTWRVDGSELLPRVSGVVADATVDPTLVHFRAHGDLAIADGAMAVLDWDLPTEHRWVVYAPPDVTSPIRLPRLPRELAPWGPSADVTVNTSVMFWESTETSGYEDVRVRPGDAFRGTYVGPVGPGETTRATMGWKN